MGQGAARPHSGRDEGRFRQFLFGDAMIARLPRMDVDAIGALSGERDAERDQRAVFDRNDAIVSFRAIVEGEERRALRRRQGEQER